MDPTSARAAFFRTATATTRAGALTLALLVLAGCGASRHVADAGEAPPTLSGPAPEPTDHAPLPAGAVVQLAPTRLAVSAPPGTDAVTPQVFDGLLREALRQSVRFDFAAPGVERARHCAAHLEPHLDAAAGVLTLAVRIGDDAPVPLAAGENAGRDAAAAVDRVAWAARRGLGERLVTPPHPVNRIYSDSMTCVRQLEQALRDEARGLDGSARNRVGQALRADPGCTLAVLTRGHQQLAAGDADAAERTANQALTLLPGRMGATTQHRLARLLLLARAQRTRSRQAAARSDEQLLALGEELLRERPHDPHGLLTRALARNYLGRFEAAVVDLRTLHERWPEQPAVGYHLCFAELATDHPEAAVAAIEAELRHLPAERSLLPHALALYHADSHDALRELLTDTAARTPDDSPLQHELLRMRAAHAILSGDADAAARFLLEDLEWMRVRPSRLDRLTADIVENGESLGELGFAAALERRLPGLAEVGVTSSTFDLALTYLQGLCTALRDPTAPEVQLAVDTLEQADETAWAARLRGQIALHAGDLTRAAAELATALRLSDRPLARARFSQVLQRLGRHDQARQLLDETRERLLAIDLRRPSQHPLSSPGRALAFLAASRAAD